ncbi:IS110 family transposase [Amycolatopsis sp. 195334CR]|uniref:IS110 family transposase n=1 Tax=Amycolatopsis sp. 195334CR TaxID=2814588 RepID=UPI001A8F02BD|nr:IS110 family transposase [Amycolatopsis sp. 195334CR]MBN6037019.1 IS110 family transposase [Amycolatopsis sp. 195334CR]
MTDQHGIVDTAQHTAVIAGVDTHKDTHTAAALDPVGRVLGTHTFPATTAGYTALGTWLAGFGTVSAAGVEGTGSYGAGLARYLAGEGVTVVEVNQPDRHARRRKGKTDTQDAINTARAVLAGHAEATPKAGTGPAAAITALRTALTSAVKSRTAALNQLHALIVTAPAPLRESLSGLTGTTLIRACARLRPGTDLTSPVNATKTALRRLARRITDLTTEITDAKTDLNTLTRQVLPATTAVFGVGPDTAAQLLATAGDNPDRITTEAQFAHLCGTAPIDASSGRNNRHRLNRGGDRHANAALHRIVIVRLRHCPRTRAYLERRTREGLPKRHIIRCLKRYVAREIHRTITTDIANLATTP